MIKIISSRKIDNKIAPNFKEFEEQSQFTEICAILKTKTEIFKKFTIPSEGGVINLVELYILEPGELEEYHKFRLWKKEQANILGSHMIKKEDLMQLYDELRKEV